MVAGKMNNFINTRCLDYDCDITTEDPNNHKVKFNGWRIFRESLGCVSIYCMQDKSYDYAVYWYGENYECFYLEGCLK